jgi:predicted lipase
MYAICLMRGSYLDWDYNVREVLVSTEPFDIGCLRGDYYREKAARGKEHLIKAPQEPFVDFSFADYLKNERGFRKVTFDTSNVK